MHNRYIIIIVSLCLCIPGLAWGRSEPAEGFDGFKGVLVRDVGSSHHESVYLAQDDSHQPPEKNADDTTVKAGENSPGTDPPRKENNAKKSPKDIKPFVPSEQIPADQGVDFPYNI